MRKILPVLVAIALIIFKFTQGGPSSGPAPRSYAQAQGDGAVEQAFQQHQSNIYVQGSGTAVKLLRDDLEGIRHQKFLLRLASGQTILIAHNMDIAGRIDDLKVGDTVEFAGEYVWDAQGGLVHWTHSDPEGRHAPGWLKHNGRTYQ